MHRLIFMRHLLTILLCVLAIGATGQEQKKVALSPKVIAKSDNIEITYGQPSRRDRVVFGGLVPFDTVWRTGANEATEIYFRQDAIFGDKKIAAGRYTLFTIPSEKSWEIILNKQLGQWGAYEYEKYKRKNVLRTRVPVYSLPETEECLTITVTKDAVRFEWEKTGAAVPVKIIAP